MKRGRSWEKREGLPTSRGDSLLFVTSLYFQSQVSKYPRIQEYFHRKSLLPLTTCVDGASSLQITSSSLNGVIAIWTFIKYRTAKGTSVHPLACSKTITHDMDQSMTLIDAQVHFLVSHSCHLPTTPTNSMLGGMCCTGTHPIGAVSILPEVCSKTHLR